MAMHAGKTHNSALIAKWREKARFYIFLEKKFKRYSNREFGRGKERDK